MSTFSWVYDAWFIAIASIFLTLAIEPVLKLLIDRIRALQGSFTGQYLAISSLGEAVVVEIAHCRHVGDRVQGKILGVSYAKYEGGDFDDNTMSYKNGKLKELAPSNARYEFEGMINDGLFLLSYRTLIPGTRGAGSLTLYANDSGTILKGEWGGLDEGKVVAGPCYWLKLDRKNEVVNNRNFTLKEAENLLSDIDRSKPLLTKRRITNETMKEMMTERLHSAQSAFRVKGGKNYLDNADDSE